MFCTKCGAELTDNSTFCPNCGTPVINQHTENTNAHETPIIPKPIQNEKMEEAVSEVQAQQPIVSTKKKNGTIGKVILAVVLIAALAVGGFFAYKHFSRNTTTVFDPTLEKAITNSATELKSITATLPNLSKMAENVEAMKDSDALHMKFDADFGDGNNVVIDCDMNTKAKCGLATGDVNILGVHIPFSLYIDKEQMQFASTALLDDGEAVMLPLKDFPAKWNASALSKLTNLMLPEGLNFDGLFEPDSKYDEVLVEAYGDTWTTFRDSVKFEEVNNDTAQEKPYFHDKDGTNYVLVWDKDALNKLIEEANVAKDKDILFDSQTVNSLSDFHDLDLKKFAAENTVSMLNQLQDKLDRVEILVENERATGLYIAAHQENENEYVAFHLEGKDNPWSQIFVKINGKNGPHDVMVHVTVNGDVLLISGEEAVEGGTPQTATLEYNDTTGIIIAKEDGEPLNNATIALTPVETGIRLSFSEKKDTGSIEFSTKTNEIKPVSDNPVKILELNEQELQEFVVKIYGKIMTLQQ